MLFTMGRNSGKRTHHKCKFAPPAVPKSESLESHQFYGVITQYHGGCQRNMDVTIYDSVSGTLKNVKCRLKGSLRHFKCRQRVQIGSFVVTDYEDVIIIFTSNQHASIPEDTFCKLNKISREYDAKSEAKPDTDFYDVSDSASESEIDDDDIVFGDPIDDQISMEPDIDLI